MRTSIPLSQKVIPAPEMRQFTDEAEFRTYVVEATRAMPVYLEGGTMLNRFGGPEEIRMSEKRVNDDTSIPSIADRYSKTNVQVVGVDEPDIFKTDREHSTHNQQAHSLCRF